MKKFLIGMKLAGVFLMSMVGTYFLTTIIMSTITPKKGTLSYAESMIGEEAERVQKIFANFSTKGVGNAKVALETTTEYTDLNEESVIAEIMVPVADFGSAEESVVSGDNNVKYISVADLSPKKKVLRLDDKYFLEDWTSGAKFKIWKFSGAGAKAFAQFAKENLPKWPTRDSTLTFIQTGVTALARGMNRELTVKRGDAKYFGKEVRELLRSADITHISNEVSFAQGNNLETDTASTTLCADERFGELIKDLEIDIIELTGNHLNDCGREQNVATLKKYDEVGIKYFGGGRNSEEAGKSLAVEEKNTKIALIGVNNSTSTQENGEGATENGAGANIYNAEKTKQAIKEAKEQGRVAIVDVQFFECYAYPDDAREYPLCDRPVRNQQAFFRSLIDMGADIVVGTQAHQPQTYELYKDKPIYYGLGNLFFDQTYWPGTTRSLVLKHYFNGGKLMQTAIIPTMYDKTLQPKIMDKEKKTWLLERLSPTENL